MLHAPNGWTEKQVVINPGTILKILHIDNALEFNIQPPNVTLQVVASLSTFCDQH